MTIEDFIKGFISDHEGELSLDPADNGNWSGGHRGSGIVIGSKYGVTAAALASYRNVPVSSITKEDMANLTEDEAVRIGVAGYYYKPGFNRLLWNRVTASVVDKGWGSGPVEAIKLLQRMIGVPADGQIGPQTVKAYSDYLQQKGEVYVANQWAAVRIHFDTGLNQPRFIHGWNNRTNSFLPGTEWWNKW